MQSFPSSRFRRPALSWLALGLLAGPSSAMGSAMGMSSGDATPRPALLAYPIQAYPNRAPGTQQSTTKQHLVPVYQQSIDLAVSDKSFQVGYRENSLREDGFWNAELLINDENDIALNVRLMRVGQLVGTPARLGVGVGAYGVFFDDSDQDLYALALLGSAQYDLPTEPPTTASLEIAVAPDISTFKDGEDLLDIILRVELEVSKNAVAFVGARVFDAQTEFDDEFTSELQVGVRLGI